MDMANNIWSWEENSTQYSPNPNPFFSLKKPTFLIGLRLASNCQDAGILARVQEWLKKGLQLGIGSQVNTGYGELITKESRLIAFYILNFKLQGQLIHGCQKFTNIHRPYKTDKNSKLKPDTIASAEVRSTAFRSMMRYWFRVFASGVLPLDEVHAIEIKVFGGIKPQPKSKYGYLKVNVLNGKVVHLEPRPYEQGRNDPCGEQTGQLILTLSSETPLDKQESVKSLTKHLVWFLTHMGGIGQGARRPVYSRQTRQYAPWFRGSKISVIDNRDFWLNPEIVSDFQTMFKQRLKNFYAALQQLTDITIDYHNPRQVSDVSSSNWSEAIDRNCQIVVCRGKSNNNKPYALSVLHSSEFNPNGNYNPYLCGKVGKKKEDTKPSPVWIADLGDYQIVTVFGATADPRKRFINELESKTAPNNFAQIFPL
jgi:CRISPR-associated protein Cmr6